MRLTLRLLGGIWLAALAAAAGLAYLQVAEERHQLTVDLERRAGLLGEGLRDAVEPALARGSRAGIERLLKKLGKPDQGIAVYDKGATLITATRDLTSGLPASLPEVTTAMSAGVAQQGFTVINGRTLYAYSAPVVRDDRPLGAVAVFLDASHLPELEWSLWRHHAIRFSVLALVLSAIGLIIVNPR